ncbi:transposase IS200-family protein [Bacillus methanolicus PB1]|uniref:Transposase IS200-family protein n=1 Tax=Bacillus methanolicus PB1 TaxID=997296 RepID=I3E1I5_BACMT|nr:transposase IS200-family protein [Bacillus methanolicus PB1]
MFDNEISDFAKEMFIEIGNKYNILLVEWNHDKDHIHILFKAHPNSELSKFINAYKSASSRLIKKNFPYVRKNFGKKCFGQGVFAC